MSYKSIHGRQFGITSTGGLAQYLDSTGGGSTAIGMYAQMWGSEMITNVSSGGTLKNTGLNILSTATAAVVTYTMAAPVAGVLCEVVSDTTSSGVTIETTADTINFNSSGGTSSTALSITLAAGTKGQHAILRGLSATRWQILSKSGAVS